MRGKLHYYLVKLHLQRAGFRFSGPFEEYGVVAASEREAGEVAKQKCGSQWEPEVSEITYVGGVDAIASGH